jgi:hypothetical protein
MALRREQRDQYLFDIMHPNHGIVYDEYNDEVKDDADDEMYDDHI